MIVVYIFGFGISIYFLFKKREWRKQAFFLCIGSLITIAFWLIEFFHPSNEITMLYRGEKGEREETYLLETDMDGEKREISLKILPEAYTKEELEILCEQLKEDLEKNVLGENDSFNYITENLIFPEQVENYPFLLIWSTDHPGIINEQGKLGEDIPKDGTLVQITVHISNEKSGFDIYHSFYGNVYPSNSLEARFQRLEKKLIDNEKSNRQEKIYVLPKEFEGSNISFLKKQSSKSKSVFLVVLIGFIAIAAARKQEAEKFKQERRLQLEKEYPKFISRMAMLIGAGMTINGAFKRIVLDYSRKKREKKNLLYEELLITYREMESGISEKTAYQNLGSRCQLVCISRFTALLIQYLESGAGGLKRALNEETNQALKERRDRAKKSGEEAGTKLLLPMTLMLIIVMTMIMIPAFCSFGL